MATTGRSSRSVLRPLSSSHNQRSPSPCNLNLRFKFSPGNIPKPSVTVSNQKRKCLCSPTTHPGSFRCSYHRRLEHEKTKTLASLSAKRTRIVGLNLRKFALLNSLKKIVSVEAERFRRSLAANLVKTSSVDIHRRSEFRPRLSRFCNDQDLIN